MRCCITLLRDAPALVRVKLLLVASPEDGCVAPSPGEREVHGFVKELEALDLVDGGLGRFWVLKNNESLALGLQVRLGDDVDDVSILGENGTECLLERFRLDALLEITHVNTVDTEENRSPPFG